MIDPAFHFREQYGLHQLQVAGSKRWLALATDHTTTQQ
jgi:hypothetical protein